MTAKVMGFLVLLALLAPAVIAAPPTSFDGAWTYLFARNQSGRWLVVSPKKSRDQYFQCENVGDSVRCVVPVWVKRLPGRGGYIPSGDRATPYPDVEGSQLKEFLDPARLAKAEAVLKAQGLAPSLVHSQIKNQQMTTIGTQCDLRVMVPMTYERFEALARSYLKEVFGASETDGYEFETDQ